MKTFTKNSVSKYVFESIREDLGKDVGILSCEAVAKGWSACKDGSGTFKIWEVRIADSGEVYYKRVCATKNNSGEAKSIKIY
jgi:hypothetical protein